MEEAEAEVVAVAVGGESAPHQPQQPQEHQEHHHQPIQEAVRRSSDASRPSVPESEEAGQGGAAGGPARRHSGRITFSGMDQVRIDQPEQDWAEYGLKVRNAYKSHGNVPVLKGLNMSVPVGSTYALLGPSGCGKTTLLSCCVGLMDLDSGSISMNTTKRKHVGFMPQTVALYFLLTIWDTFQYYGRIYGLTSGQIKKRGEEIFKLLELPDMDSVVETLSGGQQRRLSLAVTLLNDPKIIILDEPTVGLDPVLSHSIWKHLLEICSRQGRTIIITTHYIEEARQAHMVGLMRGGILLCEDTPAAIMANQNCDSMERAFLQLSRIQQNTEIYCGPAEEQPKRRLSVTKQRTSPIEDTPMFSCAGFFAELVKNVLFIRRNKAMLAFSVGMPIIVSFLFYAAIGHDPDGLRMAVVNSEVGDSGCNAVHVPIALQRCQVNLTSPISCRLLDRYDKMDIELVPYESIELAKKAALKNAVWGVIQFMPNYTQYLDLRLTRNLKSSDSIIQHSMPTIWLDMSNYNYGLLLQAKLYEGVQKMIADFMTECGWPDRILGVPIKFEDPVYGNMEFNLNHYASPAIVILVIFSLPLMYAVGVIVEEKETGVLQRSLVAGVSMMDVILSHYVLQILVLIVQIWIVIFLIFYMWGSPFIGNPLVASTLLLLQGLSGLSAGFLLAVIFDKAIYATLVGVSVVLSFLLLSGMIWPQEGQYTLLKWFRWMSPTTYSIESLRANTAKGWSLDASIVSSGYLSIITWIVVYTLATHLVMRYRNLLTSSFSAMKGLTLKKPQKQTKKK